MRDTQGAAQKGAPRAALVCLIISASAILLLAWYLDWAPYHKTYAVLFVVTFLATFAGWARSTEEDEARQAVREMNERDRDRG